MMNPELVTKLQSFPGSPTLEKAQRQLLLHLLPLQSTRLTQIMEMGQEEWAAQLEHEEEEGDDEDGALDHV